MFRHPLFSSLSIGLLAGILLIPFLGQVHLFDWDEINFAECAREMLVTGNFSTVQMNFQPFWEKPPLFIWMQAISMHCFGINDWAARLPNAVCGSVTLVVLWRIGQKIYDRRFAGFWVLAYAGSLLPHFYFQSGIIDPWFNLFIFLGIYQFIIYTNAAEISRQKIWNRPILLSSLFIGLAVLTKGPVALLVFGLCFLVYRIYIRKPIITWIHFGIYVLVLSIVAGSWFLILAITGNAYVILEFIFYQIRLFSTEDAGHGGNFFYHWIILLIGCFPASVLVIPALYKGAMDTPWESHALKWMRILFWVVLILFSIAKTKIVHYSSLCYFPLTYMAAYSMYKMSLKLQSIKRGMVFLLAVIGGLWALIFMVIPFIDQVKIKLLQSGIMHDPFTAECLEANGNWQGWEGITGLIILIGLVICSTQLYRRFRKSMYWLFGSTILAITIAVVLIVPRVELYSQDAAIRFWKSKADQDVYVETLFYKSYAPYFYAEVQPRFQQNILYRKWRETKPAAPLPGKSRSEYEIELQREWMLTGPIDKPAYFACKINRQEEVRNYYPDLRLIKSENGFVFWERLPNL